MPKLLIDAGNSRIKWALMHTQNGLDVHNRDVHNHSTLDELIAAWQSMSEPAHVWLASVRDEAFNNELISAVNRLWSLPVKRVTSVGAFLGVTNGYTQPAQLGCDRWAAMLAAFNLQNSSVLVVNVGTALTIDAIDATGLHLGGLISPGLNLQKNALLAGTNIPPLNFITYSDSITSSDSHGVDGEISLFANSTQKGILAGSLYAISGLIDASFQSLLQCTQQTAQAAQPICYLAGGDATKIKDILHCPYVLEPSLVLKGIALIASTE